MWGLLIGIAIIFTFMWALGMVFESDLKELERTNPRRRKFLKDKFGI